MKKILIFLVCFFAFTFNLYADTYYDKEIVKVDTLPTASEITLNKVYQVNNKYYVTIFDSAGYTPVPLNENLKGKTIYFNFPKGYHNEVTFIQSDIWLNAKCKTNFVSDCNGRVSANKNNSIYGLTFDFGNSFIPYVYHSSNASNFFSHTITVDYKITLFIYKDSEKYISLTPFETTYNWKEVNKTDVIKYETKIYVPEKERYKCYVVQSEGVIRGYEEIPKNNTTINYRDYYINSDYIFRDGHQTFGTNSTLPFCLSADIITDDYYYRLDFYKILIMFLIISIVCIYIPLKIFFKIFKRGAF